MEQFYATLEDIIQKYGITDEDVAKIQQALDALTDLDDTEATIVMELPDEANQAEDAN